MNRPTFGKRALATTPHTGSDRAAVRPPYLILGMAILAVAGAFMVFGGAADIPPTPSIAQTQNTMWVKTQRLWRYTCPSTECGIVGNFYYRAPVVPLETRDGWVRVSKYYDASCTNGRSDYVDTGNAQCVEPNGVVDGQFAEWVEESNLSVTQPADPAARATGLAKLIAGSDDFNLYESQFVEAAGSLLSRGLCTEQEMAEFGGFWESINLRPRKAYFIQCGQEKFYVDLATMEIFQR